MSMGNAVQDWKDSVNNKCVCVCVFVCMFVLGADTVLMDVWFGSVPLYVAVYFS